MKDFSKPRVVSSTTGLNCLFALLRPKSTEGADNEETLLQFPKWGSGLCLCEKNSSKPRAHSFCPGSYSADRQMHGELYSQDALSALHDLNFLRIPEMWVNVYVCFLTRRGIKTNAEEGRVKFGYK